MTVAAVILSAFSTSKQVAFSLSWIRTFHSVSQLAKEPAKDRPGLGLDPNKYPIYNHCILNLHSKQPPLALNRSQCCV